MNTSFLIEKLNAEPFKKGLSLVTFDEKSPQELLQILNDVCAALDSVHERDVRDEAPDQLGFRLVSFLAVLKFPLPPDVEPFKAALGVGDRGAVYPVLEYILARFPQLQKRTYLAKFLMAVDIPQDILFDEAVQEMNKNYKDLQEEFKEIHKAADKLKSTTAAPGELKREIAQLTEERNQLTEKIKGLQRKTAGVDGFKALLDATSSLRREQETESKLQERMYDQRTALSAAERRLAEAGRRLQESKTADKDDIPAERLLDNLRKEYEANRSATVEVLPATLQQRNETLQQLQRALMEPAKSEGELSSLRGEVARTQAEIDRLQTEIAEANRKQGDDKLALYRSQYALLSKKLQQQETEVEKAQQENDRLGRELQSKEARLSEISGPRFMKRDEYRSFAAQVRTKTNTYKQMKAEMIALRQELVVLSRTEHILKSRDHNVEEFMKQLEARKGIAGYTDTQAELAKLSALKADVDDYKGKTLNEISRIVTDINLALKEKKNKLAPQIKDLRTVRLEYQEMESAYLMAKGTYDSAAAGLESERGRLDQECTTLQDDCLREESRYHLLQSMLTILQSQADRLAEEGKFDSGDGKFLRDFKTWKEFYANKVAQQQQLTNTLRKQQKDIKENAVANSEQRAMFTDLRKLLAVKARLCRDAVRGGRAEDGGAASGFASFDEIGGANVMTLGV